MTKRNYNIDYKLGKGYPNKEDAKKAATQYRKQGYMAKISPKKQMGLYYVYYKKKY